MIRKRTLNKPFLFTVIGLTVIGFIAFYSASLSLIGKDRDNGSYIFMQALGLVCGYIGMYIIYKLPLTQIKKFHWIIFAIAAVLNLIVFIPGVGLEHGGAIRWIRLGPITIQPSEIMKFAYIITVATLLSKTTLDKYKNIFWSFGIPSIAIVILMYLQKDTDPMVVMIIAGLSMLFVSGIKIKKILTIGLLLAIAGGILISTRPYIKNRILTYFQPEAVSVTGSRWQVDQSLIAIGSGNLTGRGLGQSIQKFNYLPEPMADSIFAVSGEEFGFVGSSILVLAYLLFAIFGFKIASKSVDLFSRLIVVGLVILVITESFLNIMAMLNIIPLSGMPLLFISHGGTALAIIIAEMGIILNVSKNK